MAGATGTEYWKDLKIEIPYHDIGEQKVVHVLLVTSMCLEIPAVLFDFCWRISEASKEKNPFFLNRFKKSHFLLQLFFMPVLMGVWFAYAHVPGTRSATDLHPLLMLAYSGQFLQTIHRMQVRDKMSADFLPFRRTHLLTWALLGLNAFALI